MDVEDIRVCLPERGAYAGPAVCLACLHPDGRFELVGSAWERELGFAPAELEGRRLAALIALGGDDALALLRRMLDPGDPDPFGLPMRRRGGGVARLELFRRYDDYDGCLYLAGEALPAAPVTSTPDPAPAGLARS